MPLYGIQGRVIEATSFSKIRRHFRLPRVAHGLRRLVVIGSDGFLSLATLRWLADQDAAFVMLERDGSVLATRGRCCHPTRNSGVDKPWRCRQVLRCRSRAS